MTKGPTVARIGTRLFLKLLVLGFCDSHEDDFCRDNEAATAQCVSNFGLLGFDINEGLDEGCAEKCPRELRRSESSHLAEC